jgi:hypothetical protein
MGRRVSRIVEGLDDRQQAFDDSDNPVELAGGGGVLSWCGETWEREKSDE